MKITKNQIDDLNAVLTLVVSQEDYSQKVEEALSNYRKRANIPGFRKGHVPMGMIKKQYGRALQVDEVNKLLQAELNKYLEEEKLEILGNPLPKENPNFDWDAPELTFEFELGLSPDFKVDVKFEKPVPYYQIKVEDSLVQTQIDRIRSQFGKLVTVPKVEEDSELTGLFFNEAEKIDKSSTFAVSKLSAEAQKEVLGHKVGDQITLKTKGLFQDAHDLMHYLGVDHDAAHHLDVEVTFTLEEVNKREPAELNEELFQKLFPDGSVTTPEQLKEQIAKNIQQRYDDQAEQQLLNDVTEYLLENTPFNLPDEFLTKWIKTAGEKQLTQEEAEKEYEKSRNGLRYQLIENKIITENNLQTNYEELKNFAESYVRAQMLQYGIANPDEKNLQNIVQNVLQNREEVTRLNQQLTAQKLIKFYKENANLDKKEVSYDEFIKLAYPEQ